MNMLSRPVGDDLPLNEGLSYFEYLYGQSSLPAAVTDPVRNDDGLIIDVKFVVGNDAWHLLRRIQVTPGMKGSDFYSGFDSLLQVFSTVDSVGRETQTFSSDSGDGFVAEGLVQQVEWRKLPNGMILETSRDQTLVSAALEASGPVLIIELPEDGQAPTHAAGMNRSFIEHFMIRSDATRYTVGASGFTDEVSLLDIRKSVAARFPDNDWDAFHAANARIHQERTPVEAIPFFMGGEAYLRDFSIHQLPSSRSIGIWVYRPAGVLALQQIDDFAEARVLAIAPYVKNLSRPVAAHRAVLSESGNIIDLENIWANDSFNSYRFKPLESGDLASKTRVRFTEDLLPVLRQAWNEGEATQFFRFESNDFDAKNYRDEFQRAAAAQQIEIETIFVRTDDGFILEWGDDIDQKRRLGSEREQQRKIQLDILLDLQRQESERETSGAFVRELHDNVLQDLFVVGLSLHPHTMSDSPPAPPALLKEVHESLARIATDIRTLISGDRELSDGLLTSQLEELCEQWSQTSNFDIGLEVKTAYDATVFERIPERVTRNLTLIVKEAISNAVRHSGGTTINIRLVASGGILKCTIRDNGNGFPASHIVESGTLNLRSRAELLGGSARIESTKSGVTVDVTVPLPIEQV